MRKIVLSFASLVLITSFIGTSIFIISKNKGPVSNEPSQSLRHILLGKEMDS